MARFKGVETYGERYDSPDEWWLSTATEHAALETKVGRTWSATSGCACDACMAARKAGWAPKK